MFDPAAVPDIEQDETVARFILFSRHYRSSDNTVRQDAFVPHPRPELSMMRHRDATIDEIWQEGRRVAGLRKSTLYGRADVAVAAFTAESVRVVPKPVLENPNHADAIDWPTGKPEQKIIALQIANRAIFVAASPL